MRSEDVQANTIVAFDFDGVLVDSYSCLPKIYETIAKEIGIKDVKSFIRVMLNFEDIMDYFGIWDRRLWFSLILRSSKIRNSDTEKLVSTYWNLRIRHSIVKSESIEVLKKLNAMKIPTYIVSGSDGIPGMKYRRVVASGLDKLVRDVLVYSVYEKVRSLAEALLKIKEKHLAAKVFYVDDKPKNLVEASKVKVNTVLYKYKPPLPTSYAWKGRKPKSTTEIRSLREILTILCKKNKYQYF